MHYMNRIIYALYEQSDKYNKYNKSYGRALL